MKKLPIITRRETVAESRLFCIEALDITFSNGVEVQYERLKTRGHGAVLVIPMMDACTVLMIREYSAGTERYELCLPKGRIEAGERAIDAANREMAEEIGYAAHKLTLLTEFSLAPGYMGHQTQIVLAEDLYPQSAEGDEPEPLETQPQSLNDLLNLGLGNECNEARSIAALYLARDYLIREAQK